MRYALLLPVLLAGCRQQAAQTAQPRTVTDVLLEDSRFTLLRQYVAYAGLNDALKSTNLTLFAPTDSAFSASGFSAVGLSPDQVRNVLLYHVLLTSLNPNNIPAGSNLIQTANGGTATLSTASDGSLRLNNATVSPTPVQAANGLVYPINRVLTPSNGSLTATIRANPNLTFLAAALTRIAPTNAALAAQFDGSNSSAGPITVFAPINAAFQSAGYANLTAIQTANPQTLANLLSYHATSGTVYANQLQTGSIATLLANNRLAVTVTGTFITLKGNRNTTLARIVTPDIQASNGVLHLIDTVLLP